MGRNISPISESIALRIVHTVPIQFDERHKLNVFQFRLEISEQARCSILVLYTSTSSYTSLHTLINFPRKTVPIRCVQKSRENAEVINVIMEVSPRRRAAVILISMRMMYIRGRDPRSLLTLQLQLPKRPMHGKKENILGERNVAFIKTLTMKTEHKK